MRVLRLCSYAVAKDAQLLTDKEYLDARQAIGPDDKTTKMPEFAKKVKQNNGDVTDEDFQMVRDAGFDDQEIVEILGTIAMITFANYVSNVGSARPRLSKGISSIKRGRNGKSEDYLSIQSSQVSDGWRRW